jgi:hypothetical protein
MKWIHISLLNLPVTSHFVFWRMVLLFLADLGKSKQTIAKLVNYHDITDDRNFLERKRFYSAYFFL